MEPWMTIAALITGAVFILLSIGLFVLRRGGWAGPLLMLGVLLSGTAGFLMYAAEPKQQAGPESTKEAGDPPPASETVEEDTVKTESTEVESEENAPISKSPEQTDDDISVSREEDDSPMHGSHESNTITAQEQAAAEEYEHAVNDSLTLLIDELNNAIDETVHYYTTGWDNIAAQDEAYDAILELDTAAYDSQLITNPPEGYEEFHDHYETFTNELLDFSDDMYWAVDDFYYTEDPSVLDEVFESPNVALFNAAAGIDDIGAKTFQYIDLQETIDIENVEESL